MCAQAQDYPLTTGNLNCQLPKETLKKQHLKSNTQQASAAQGRRLLRTSAVKCSALLTACCCVLSCGALLVSVSPCSDVLASLFEALLASSSCPESCAQLSHPDLPAQDTSLHKSHAHYCCPCKVRTTPLDISKSFFYPCTIAATISNSLIFAGPGLAKH